jgi:PAS domain S-box-containing protein
MSAMTSPLASPGSPMLDEHRFRTLIGAVTDYAIFMLDPEGRIASWNPGAERIKGYTAEEAIGQHYSIFFPEEDRRNDKPGRALEVARRSGRSEDEGWRIRKDGSRSWTLAVIDAIYDETGAVTGFAKITRDITERRRIQETLLDSERRFRRFVNGVTDYAIFMLDPEGRVTDWNSGAQRIKQYSAEEIIGENFSRFYPAEDRARGEPQRALTTAETAGKYESEGWRIRKDGSRFGASVVMEAIRDAYGALIGFAHITRDITGRRDAQRALDDAREQLFQSQKLEAIGQLTGGVAHNFNNLLAAILSGLSLVERMAGADDKLKHLLNTMRQATQRGHALTQQLLTFSRRQPLRPERLEVSKRLKQTFALLERLLSANIKMSLSVPEDLPPINVDPSEFELAILNVCLNARDATPQGGRLLIEARTEAPRDGEGAGEAPVVAIAIADTGAGIPDNIKKRVFERFFTTKDVGKGSGLGLSQAYGFAKESGGSVDISSEVEGHQRHLPLPRSKNCHERSSSEDTNAMATAQDSGTVLLIEDDLSLAELTSALLEHAGYTVKVAHSAAAALNMLKRGSHIDAVFSDIVMSGGMNGFQLARTLRKEFPDVPVLLTTGFSGAADVAQVRGIEIIPKPYDPDKVTSQLAKLIADSRRRTAH